ncbi:MerR family transcriptional regulator [Streptomyces synnematoformans]|uniref:HTH merR-type domain-containing protein n=1 Tax=Streptomyces synnematoformans TaxID=415721 RepID=A0ABN2ZGM3_9ACTN
MRIGDAAAATGTTPRALRFYEQRGLLPPPPRSATGQREYGPPDLARVRVIRELLALGLTVADLAARARTLHEVSEYPPPRCGSPDTRDAGAVVGHRIAVLDAEIARLTRLRDQLEQLHLRPACHDRHLFPGSS